MPKINATNQQKLTANDIKCQKPVKVQFYTKKRMNVPMNYEAFWFTEFHE